jgi:queuosine precursor transporter
MTVRTLQVIVIVCVLYIAAQIFSDITSLRILFLAGLSIDGGTLIYPFTFTLRDLVHKVAGATVARTLIITAAVINLLMAGLFWLVSNLPADPSVGAQAEFGLVLAPVLRIVLASIIAEVVSELIDTEMYEVWIRRVGHSKQWGRVLLSNAVSVPVDSLLFVVLAFWGNMSPDVVFSIFIANVLVKGVVTIISIPGIYLVKEKPKDWLKSGDSD